MYTIECVPTCTHLHAHSMQCICTHTALMLTYKHTHTHADKYTLRYTHTHTYHSQIHIYTHLYTHIYIYTHTHHSIHWEGFFFLNCWNWWLFQIGNIAAALVPPKPPFIPSSVSLPPFACSSSSGDPAVECPHPSTHLPCSLMHVPSPWRPLPSVSSRLGVGMWPFLFQHFASTWHFLCQQRGEVTHSDAGGSEGGELCSGL